ncbi:MAG: aldo/keto reductase, partial [Acidobacteriota bacterium]
MATSMDLAITAYFVLAAGILTGKYNEEAEGPTRLGPDSPVGIFEIPKKKLEVAAEVLKIAKEINKSPSQVALNWVRQRQKKPVMIPILGARTESQIKDNLGCLDFDLEQGHLDHLNELAKPQLGYPYQVLQSEMYRKLIYGNTFDLIENHRE